MTLIFRKRPSVISFLYERLPAQCKQCAVRFGDDASGKKAMDDHLDMHFRQNRKVNQNLGRGHSRSWFVSLEVRYIFRSRSRSGRD
jgi:pre-mRNA cleavage complex 2 protein Pcf11